VDLSTQEGRNTACLPCRQSKRKCDRGRPCQQCVQKGLEERCRDTQEMRMLACRACYVRKLKCDKIKPCRHCVNKGIPCIDPMTGEEMGNKTVCASVALGAPLRADLRSTPESTVSCSTTPGNTSDDECMQLTVMRPIAYPDGARFGFMEAESAGAFGPDVPMSFVARMPVAFRRMFRIFRVADSIVEGIYCNMTPKLQQTVIRLMGFFATPPGKQPACAASIDDPPSLQPPPLLESERCGFHQVEFDATTARTFALAGANSYYTDMAGLHQEEVVNRSISGEMRLPTSELRYFCQLMTGMEWVLKATLQGGGDDEGLVSVRRFTKSWGTGGVSEGMMCRTKQTTTTLGGPGGGRKRMRTSMVVISHEEYEAAVQQRPECCEELAALAVGRKPVQELCSAHLIHDEAFATLRSTDEGCQTLDKLADILDARFASLFQSLAAKTNPGGPPQ